MTAFIPTTSLKRLTFINYLLFVSKLATNRRSRYNFSWSAQIRIPRFGFKCTLRNTQAAGTILHSDRCATTVEWLTFYRFDFCIK